MQNHVIIKSSKYGVSIHLDPDTPYEDLCKELKNKFAEAVKFFRGAKMAVSFEGRILTKAQEHELIELITSEAQIQIVCIMDHSEKTEEMHKSVITKILEEPRARDGQFYKGTLKRRQVLESETSVIILGDVDAGAKVIAKGNVIVLGTIRGTVHAGISGKDDAFISALAIRSKQLRIGDHSSYQYVIGFEEMQPFTPKIAQLDGDHIYIDPLVY